MSPPSFEPEEENECNPQVRALQLQSLIFVVTLFVGNFFSEVFRADEFVIAVASHNGFNRLVLASAASFAVTALCDAHDIRLVSRAAAQAVLPGVCGTAGWAMPTEARAVASWIIVVAAEHVYGVPLRGLLALVLSAVVGMAAFDDFNTRAGFLVSLTAIDSAWLILEEAVGPVVAEPLTNLAVEVGFVGCLSMLFCTIAADPERNTNTTEKCKDAFPTLSSFLPRITHPMPQQEACSVSRAASPGAKLALTAVSGAVLYYQTVHSPSLMTAADLQPGRTLVASFLNTHLISLSYSLFLIYRTPVSHPPRTPQTSATQPHDAAAPLPTKTAHAPSASPPAGGGGSGKKQAKKKKKAAAALPTPAAAAAAKEEEEQHHPFHHSLHHSLHHPLHYPHHEERCVVGSTAGSLKESGRRMSESFETGASDFYKSSGRSGAPESFATGVSEAASFENCLGSLCRAEDHQSDTVDSISVAESVSGPTRGELSPHDDASTVVSSPWLAHESSNAKAVPGVSAEAGQKRACPTELWVHSVAPTPKAILPPSRAAPPPAAGRSGGGRSKVGVPAARAKPEPADAGSSSNTSGIAAPSITSSRNKAPPNSSKSSSSSSSSSSAHSSTATNTNNNCTTATSTNNNSNSNSNNNVSTSFNNSSNPKGAAKSSGNNAYIFKATSTGTSGTSKTSSIAIPAAATAATDKSVSDADAKHPTRIQKKKNTTGPATAAAAATTTSTSSTCATEHAVRSAPDDAPSPPGTSKTRILSRSDPPQQQQQQQHHTPNAKPAKERPTSDPCSAVQSPQGSPSKPEPKAKASQPKRPQAHAQHPAKSLVARKVQITGTPALYKRKGQGDVDQPAAADGAPAFEYPVADEPKKDKDKDKDKDKEKDPQPFSFLFGAPALYKRQNDFDAGTTATGGMSSSCASGVHAELATVAYRSVSPVSPIGLGCDQSEHEYPIPDGSALRRSVDAASSWCTPVARFDETPSTIHTLSPLLPAGVFPLKDGMQNTADHSIHDVPFLQRHALPPSHPDAGAAPLVPQESWQLYEQSEELAQHGFSLAEGVSDEASACGLMFEMARLEQFGQQFASNGKLAAPPRWPSAASAEPRHAAHANHGARLQEASPPLLSFRKGLAVGDKSASQSAPVDPLDTMRTVDDLLSSVATEYRTPLLCPFSTYAPAPAAGPRHPPSVSLMARQHVEPREYSTNGSSTDIDTMPSTSPTGSTPPSSPTDAALQTSLLNVVSYAVDNDDPTDGWPSAWNGSDVLGPMIGGPPGGSRAAGNRGYNKNGRPWQSVPVGAYTAPGLGYAGADYSYRGHSQPQGKGLSRASQSRNKYRSQPRNGHQGFALDPAVTRLAPR
ncbi:hypothetical protein DIPPA_10782 [Diplonema papillatum]|nr:hypothetical protein DIPPA_10782 [Diplonema papillatum]